MLKFLLRMLLVIQCVNVALTALVVQVTNYPYTNISPTHTYTLIYPLRYYTHTLICTRTLISTMFVNVIQPVGHTEAK